LKTKDIIDLPVKDITSDNAILFLWATFPNLPEAFKVIESWGFDYKTIGFTWIKLNRRFDKIFNRLVKSLPSSSGDLINEGIIEVLDKLRFFGIGAYSKSNAEVCLIATKGKPKIKDNTVSSIIFAPIQQHSRKPEEVRKRIEKLMGEDVGKIELFATEKVKGWTSVGLAIDGRDIRNVLKK